jgi:hypothetical protein
MNNKHSSVNHSLIIVSSLFVVFLSSLRLTRQKAQSRNRLFFNQWISKLDVDRKP